MARSAERAPTPRVALALSLALAPSLAYAQSPPPPPAPAPAPAPRTRDDFAAALMRDGDYFRAIGVYKELAFFTDDPHARATYALRIGTAYRLAHRYELAIDAFSAMLARPEAAPELLGSAYAQIGASYVGLKVSWQADTWLAQARAHGAAPLAALYEGAARAAEGKWDEAKRAFDEAARGAPGTPIGTTSLALSERLSHADEMSHRSPVLAGLMSAILPGSGQAYVGHWWDAFQAAGIVAGLAFVSFIAYEHDRDQGGPYWLTGASLSLTTFVHAANVLGAVRTADYYNTKQRDTFLDPIRSRALDFEP